MEYTSNTKFQSLSFSEVIHGYFYQNGIVRAVTEPISSVGNQMHCKSSELRLFLPSLKGPSYKTWQD